MKKNEMSKSGPMTTLIVDDEVEVCQIFEKWLSWKGHKVKSVLTGKRAIKSIQKESYDVVFSDILMPGISGMDLLGKIKKISPKTKVIMITGQLIDENLQDELMEKGASGFLQKPFKIEDIISILKKIK